MVKLVAFKINIPNLPDQRECADVVAKIIFRLLSHHNFDVFVFLDPILISYFQDFYIRDFKYFLLNMPY